MGGGELRRVLSRSPGHPPRFSNVRGDPPELSENRGGCRAPRPLAGGSGTLDQEPELLRKKVVLQFLLRLPAQQGGGGPQPLGPRAAAGWNPPPNDPAPGTLSGAIPGA